MNAYCRTLKVPLNKKQNVEYMTERAKQQYEHFQAEIEKIIKGHRDQDFQDGLIAFITGIQLVDLTEAEKELIFSKTLTNTLEGRIVKDIIQEFLNETAYLNVSPIGMSRKMRRENTVELKLAKTKAALFGGNQSGEVTLNDKGMTEEEKEQKLSLIEQERKRVRDNGLEKLKKALNYTNEEKLDTPPSSSTDSSAYSENDENQYLRDLDDVMNGKNKSVAPFLHNRKMKPRNQTMI